MDAFMDSVGSIFRGGDVLPWCDRDIIAVSSFVLPAPHAALSPRFSVLTERPWLGLGCLPGEAW
jgi:hypothetical protein